MRQKRNAVTFGQAVLCVIDIDLRRMIGDERRNIFCITSNHL